MVHNQVAERKMLKCNIQHFSIFTEKQKQKQKKAERPSVMATAGEEQDWEVVRSCMLTASLRPCVGGVSFPLLVGPAWHFLGKKKKKDSTQHRDFSFLFSYKISFRVI